MKKLSENQKNTICSFLKFSLVGVLNTLIFFILYYAVLMIDGSKRMVDKSLSYSIPRLKPEVRSMFNALSDAIIDYDNKRKAASQAYVESSRASDRLNKLV